jgi:glycosyltransferase involved in cell wall biosynthesis
MQGLGADTSVVFVTESEPLSTRLDAAGIAHTSLGLSRGSQVAFHPRALARSVRSLGPDGVLLPRGGYLAASLRIGGYHGRTVATVHDATLEIRGSIRHRILRPIDRASGSWATDVDVAVSDFVLSQMQRQPRRGRLVRIYNGVDLDVYTGNPGSTSNGVTIGSAGRLVKGKGTRVLLRAFADGAAREGARLRIAGEGPERSSLQALAAELGLNDSVEFMGWTADMPSFWRACDVAVLPSDGVIESFGMAAVEAMACARPVVATANGALPELVDDGVTGSVVPPGDAEALARALLTLTRDVDRRRAAGSAARARCERQFDIRDCASSYLELFRADTQSA